MRVIVLVWFWNFSIYPCELLYLQLMSGLPISDLSSQKEPIQTPVDLPLLFENMEKTAKLLSDGGQSNQPSVWRKVSSEYKLPALDLPTSVGGSNWLASDMVRVFEQAGRYSLDMRDMVGGGHSRILKDSEKKEHQKIMREVALGNAYVAIAITEKGVGSEYREMTTIAKRDGNHYILSGEKMYIARLEAATHIILFVRMDSGSSGLPKLTAFSIPRDFPGLKFESLNARGLKGNSFGGVSFKDIRVPEYFRIGKEGEAGRLFKEHFTYWRLMQTAAAVGSGKEALAMAARRLVTRMAFGGPIGRFTHFQQDLARHTSALHMLSLLLKQAAEKIDEGDWEASYTLSVMAKSEGVEAALKAADSVMELFGAEGYTDQLDIGQRVADLQGLRIADGTTHVLRGEAVRHIYGEDFWSLAVGKKVSEFQGPAEAFQTLRQRHANYDMPVLPNANNYNDLISPFGGGACATVAATYFIQGLRLLGGNRNILNTHRLVLWAFNKFPELKLGRVSNEQMDDLIRFLDPLVSKNELEFSVETALNQSSDVRKSPKREWESFSLEKLKIIPGELKMLAFTVTSTNGRTRGRHFVILESVRSDGTITVIDPNLPSKQFVYDLKIGQNRSGNGVTVKLVRPGMEKIPGETRYLDSIFTGKLID